MSHTCRPIISEYLPDNIFLFFSVRQLAELEIRLNFQKMTHRPFLVSSLEFEILKDVEHELDGILNRVGIGHVICAVQAADVVHPDRLKLSNE